MHNLLNESPVLVNLDDKGCIDQWHFFQIKLLNGKTDLQLICLIWKVFTNICYHYIYFNCHCLKIQLINPLVIKFRHYEPSKYSVIKISNLIKLKYCNCWKRKEMTRQIEIMGSQRQFSSLRIIMFCIIRTTFYRDYMRI